MQTTVLGVLTILISIVALVFSILAYKRGASIENENHLFKLKVDIYSKLLLELNKLLDALNDHFKNAKKILNDKPYNVEEKIEEQAKIVDKRCFEFSDFVVSQSLIIPEAVLAQLIIFTEKIIENQELPDQHLLIDRLGKLLAELLNDANDINIALRNDLHIDKLNMTMYRRLH